MISGPLKFSCAAFNCIVLKKFVLRPKCCYLTSCRRSKENYINKTIVSGKNKIRTQYRKFESNFQTFRKLILSYKTKAPSIIRLVKVKIIDIIQPEKSPTVHLCSRQKNRRRPPLHQKKVDAPPHHFPKSLEWLSFVVKYAPKCFL